MNNLDVFIAQLTPRLGDKKLNYQIIKETMMEAKKNNSQLVVFPELFLSGYSIGNKVNELAETVDGPYLTKIRDLCKEMNLHVVISFPEDGQDGNYYIASSFIDNNGEVLGTYRKMHLFDIEKKFFTPGEEFKVVETKFGKVGLMICFDVEFPEMARALKLKGADLLIIVNANMHPYKNHHHIYARSRAMENEITVIICNRLGVEDELEFCGDSMIVDAFGEVVLSLGKEENTGLASINLSQNLDPKMNYVKNRRKELYGILT